MNAKIQSANNRQKEEILNYGGDSGTELLQISNKTKQEELVNSSKIHEPQIRMKSAHINQRRTNKNIIFENDEKPMNMRSFRIRVKESKRSLLKNSLNNRQLKQVLQTETVNMFNLAGKRVRYPSNEAKRINSALSSVNKTSVLSMLDQYGSKDYQSGLVTRETSFLNQSGNNLKQIQFKTID